MTKTAKHLLAVLLCMHIMAGLSPVWAEDWQVADLWVPDPVPQLQASEEDLLENALPSPQAERDAAPLAAPPAEMYYARNQYTGKQKTAYDLMDQAVKNYDYASDTQTYKGPSVRLPGFTTQQEIENFVNTYVSDHPEIYNLENRYAYVLGETDSRVILVVNDPARYNDGLFWAKTKELLRAAEGKTTDYEKALALHDALIGQVSYDMQAPNKQTAYGAIVDGRCVCDGYARAYQLLLQLSGIQSARTLGQVAAGYHAWNIVRLDGQYYYTDPTWDDPEAGLSYEYFNLPFQYISEDHTLDPVFGLEYPGGSAVDKMYHNMFFVENTGQVHAAGQAKTMAKQVEPYKSKLFLCYTGSYQPPCEFSFKRWVDRWAYPVARDVYPGFSDSHIYILSNAGRQNARCCTLTISALPADCQVYDPASPLQSEGTMQIPRANGSEPVWAERGFSARHRYDDGSTLESEALLNLYTPQGVLIQPQDYPAGVCFGQGAKSRTLLVSSEAQPQVLLLGTDTYQPKYKLTLTPAQADWVLGDYNDDGKVTQEDAYYLLMSGMQPQRYPLYGRPYDYNHINNLDQGDAYQLLMHTMQPERYPLDPLPVE